MKNALRITAAFALIAGSLGAQNLKDVYDGLKAERWQDRNYYFNELLDPENASAETNTQLIQLLEREHRIILKAAIDEVGPAAAFGEGYERYVTRVEETVMLIANKQRDRADVWAALLSGELKPASGFGRWVAGNGDKSAPILLQIARRPGASDGVAGLRRAAILELALVVEMDRKKLNEKRLDPAQLKAIGDVVRDALKDPVANVRMSAVSALGDIGTVADIPALQAVATSDPDSTPEGNPGNTYSVRDAARDAVQRLQPRR